LSSHDHVQNKISALSDDQRLVRILERTAELVERVEPEYAVIGSCGLQAYLDCFYRLPNDLDLVLSEEGAGRLVEAARGEGADFVEQLGRGKLIIEGYPIHLIPPRMAVIDKDTDHIFTSVDLTGELPAAGHREMTLVGARRSPRLRVASLEAILFVEMVRPIYTGSVMSISLALRENDISEAKMSHLLRENPALGPVLLHRVESLPAVVGRLAILGREDRGRVVARLGDLARAFREGLGEAHGC
jgi:hypothetical protein